MLRDAGETPFPVGGTDSSGTIKFKPV